MERRYAAINDLLISPQKHRLSSRSATNNAGKSQFTILLFTIINREKYYIRDIMLGHSGINLTLVFANEQYGLDGTGQGCSSPRRNGSSAHLR